MLQCLKLAEGVEIPDRAGINHHLGRLEKSSFLTRGQGRIKEISPNALLIGGGGGSVKKSKVFSADHTGFCPVE